MAVSIRVATCQPMFMTNVLVNCDYGMWWRINATLFWNPGMTLKASIALKLLGQYIISGSTEFIFCHVPFDIQPHIVPNKTYRNRCLD